MSDKSVTITITELEPGNTVFSFEKPPRHAGSRLHCLLDQLQEWRKRFPERRVEDLQIQRQAGRVTSLHALWSLFARPTVPQNYTFHVRSTVRKQHSQEFLELVMQAASHWMLSAKTLDSVVAMLSRQAVVVVNFRERQEGYFLDYPSFQDSLPAAKAAQIRQQFDKFRQQQKPGYLVIPLSADYQLPPAGGRSGSE